MYFIFKHFIRATERRLGVGLDYVHHIARVNARLLMRYNKIFGLLDPRHHLSPEAYHLARMRGALAADCGTCVEAEVNLARAAGVSPDRVTAFLGDADLGDGLNAVRRLADAVVRDRQDDPEARDAVRAAFGESGLIELSLAMNGAAMLPGIKRSLGYATACDIGLMRRIAAEQSG